METVITLREANQAFSRCIRAVQAGEAFIITRDGTPVARLVPIERAGHVAPERQAILDRFRAMWDRAEAEGLPEVDYGVFDRDSLHED